MINVKFTPAWEAPEWMLIMRATWMDAQVRREAAAEIYRRNLAGSQIELEARRVELRHGTLALVRATFAGFKALPAPDWRRTLNLSGSVTIDQVDAAYRALAKSFHSDAGGSDEAMIALNVARDAARRELGA